MHALAKLLLVDEGIQGWLLVALIFLICLFPFLIWCSRRSRARNRITLRQWTEQRELQIVWIRHPWFSNGPFAARVGFEESTYRIEVLDRVGRRRKGWVACGLSVDDVNVRWDD